MRAERRPEFAERRGIAGLGLVLTATLLASACGGGGTGVTTTPGTEGTTEAPTQAGTLTVSASECTLDLVDEPISAGPVAFTAVNETDALAAFNIARIEDVATFKRLEAHIRKEVRLAEAGKPGLGHPSFAVPHFEVLLQAGESGTLAGTLGPGTYGLTCARMYEQVGELRPAGVLGPVEVK